eukprot:TRINITY_DN778037_c0_g1_i1.p1 TRINITY_DN778037_c0_g1~~TRINITY_DN778037_c0_g1_i1.p1  ORF type:complete len:259 (-),score=62.77 TRINITY_DN778037_c0_g1_i1:162-938(-)
MSNRLAVKRIRGDIRELENNPNDRIYARPLDGDLFEWHFTVRGPIDSDFENGVYHGVIALPSEYPMKPPTIKFLTPSGRFEVDTKICLSISAHHPESWQPAWGIRTMLEAIVSMFPAPGEGAIGSLDFPSEARKTMALQSWRFKCKECGDIASLMYREKKHIPSPSCLGKYAPPTDADLMEECNDKENSVAEGKEEKEIRARLLAGEAIDKIVEEYPPIPNNTDEPHDWICVGISLIIVMILLYYLFVLVSALLRSYT